MLDDILKVFYLTQEQTKMTCKWHRYQYFCINYLFAQDPKTGSKLNCSVSEILSVCAMNYFNRSLDVGVGSRRDLTEIQNYDNPKCPPNNNNKYNNNKFIC